MNLGELVEQIAGCVIDGNPSVEVSGIEYDSRRVHKGDLFVAIEGHNVDGHKYVRDAVNRGAVALVVEHDVEVPLEISKAMVPDTRLALSRIADTYFRGPSRKIDITGVTGTNGKTTTCYLLRSIYRSAGSVAGMLTTVEYVIGSKSRRANLTTPESLDLQRIFAEMLEAGVETVAMEVSSHGLALKRVEDVRFANAVFTNISRDHLDFHGDMEEYVGSKMKLFARIRIGGLAVLNCDDPHWTDMASATSTRVVKYGFGDSADVKVIDLRTTVDGTDLSITARGETIQISSPLVGRHNAYNVAASVAVTSYSGIPADVIGEGIRRVRRVPGRLEPFILPSGARGFVDYAHTPDALEKVLAALREVTPGRVIIVFGCGGDRDRGKRPLMGDVSVRLADFTIVTSDNPRSEDPEAIIGEITSHLNSGDYRVEPDRRKAIEESISMAGPGDSVLIAGKGHEDYQLIGRGRVAFDDRKVILELGGRKT
jgi:UDP-N-acetylmuramoyl-L-alanyl-D-glutamate--2,6-diaminopimelate ligase